jgi:FKBP-type peptidyl-prolyl cis-trans isomerase SlpA
LVEHRTIGPGKAVTLHLRLTLEDGTEAENTFGSEPLHFVVGDGTLIAALERMLFGLAEGEQTSLTLTPEQAYGLRDRAAIHTLPRADFPASLAVAPGMLLSFALPDSAEIPGQVLEVDADGVTVDFNHPLAGHRLSVDVEVLQVRQAG